MFTSVCYAIATLHATARSEPSVHGQCSVLDQSECDAASPAATAVPAAPSATANSPDERGGSRPGIRRTSTTRNVRCPSAHTTWKLVDSLLRLLTMRSMSNFDTFFTPKIWIGVILTKINYIKCKNSIIWLFWVNFCNAASVFKNDIFSSFR